MASSWRGRTIGLIGLGAINRAVANRCKALGLKVLATRQSVEPFSGVDKVYGPEQLDDMLAESDIVVAAVPETPETDGLMGRARFSRMRKGAFLLQCRTWFAG
jgi:phosphoglycerate dehydrogenase-like enzyme